MKMAVATFMLKAHDARCHHTKNDKYLIFLPAKLHLKQEAPESLAQGAGHTKLLCKKDINTVYHENETHIFLKQCQNAYVSCTFLTKSKKK